MTTDSSAQDFTNIENIIAFGRFGSATMYRMSRNQYAYTYVHHGIDDIAFEVALPPGAYGTIGGRRLSPDGRSDAFPLQIGRNVFDIVVVAPDSNTRELYELKVFRAYPTPLWQRIAESAAWSPRDSAGELVFRDRMWLIGGYTPAFENDVWHSADGANWTPAGRVPSDCGIDIPVAFVFGDSMYVVDFCGVLYASDDGVRWRTVTDCAPWHGRQKMGGAVFRGKIWLMGGQQGDRLYNDIWSSDNGVDWVLEAESAPWSKRQITHSLLVFDEKMWMLGGGVKGSSYFPFVAYNDVWCTSDGVHWELVARHAPWAARIWGSTTVYRNRMWLIGGYRSEPESRHFGDVWYSADGREWLALEQHSHAWKRSSGEIPLSFPADMWADRHESSVLVHEEELYLMGGMIWPLTNEVWKLRIDGLCFLTQPVFEGYAGCLYEYRAFADFAQSGRKARYRLLEAPAWLHIDEGSGAVEGTPETAADERVVIEAFDGCGETARQQFALHVIPFR